MSLHPLVFATTPTGEPITIQDLGTKVRDLAAAEPIVRGYVARARRLGGVSVRFEVYDDLLGKSILKGRVK